MEVMMRNLPTIFLTLLFLAVSPAWSAPDEQIRVELNAAESVQSRCRLSFVIENKGETLIESLKLDLAVFSREGIIQRRLVTEMGPVVRAKTIIKAYEIESDCGQIGSILINDVAACTPGEPNLCLEKLALSSRVQNIRLFK
jgi:hypothetical protein